MMNVLFARPFYVVIVGDQGVALLTRDAETTPLFAARGDAMAEAAILDALRVKPHAMVAIYADTAQQDLRIETLPRLNILDRAQLLRQRLRTAFPKARATASLRLKDGRALLAALPKDSPVFDWVDALKTHPLKLGLLSVESAPMIAQLLPSERTDDGWSVLVTVSCCGGLRQSVVHRGVCVFSRLIPFKQSRISVEDIENDLRSTFTYLVRLGLRESREAHLVMIVPEDMRKALADIRVPVGEITLLSLADAARILGVPVNLEDGSFLHAAFFLRQAGMRLPFNVPDLRHPLIQKLSLCQRVIARGAVIFAFALAGILAVIYGHSFWERDLMNVQQNFAAPIPMDHTAVTKPAPYAFPYQELRLDAVLYYAPERWVLWMQGERIMPDTKRDDFQILEVLPQEVRLRLTGIKDDVVLNPHQAYQIDTGTVIETVKRD